MKQNVMAFGLMALVAFSAINAGADSEAACTYPDSEYTTIAEAAAGAGLSSLLQAVTASEYVGAATSTDTAVTVFAPTNGAFDAAIAGGNFDPSMLNEVIGTHLVSGPALSTDLVDGMELTTLAGATLTIGVTEGGVTVTDPSGQVVNVSTANVRACNSVVHVVDGVLSPFAAEEVEGTETATDPSVPEGTEPEGTVPEGTEAAGTEPAGTGTVPEGTEPEGTVPGGTEPEGTVPGGTEPEGTVPEGTEPEGTVPEGTEPEGTVPEGTVPEGTEPEGTEPAGTSTETGALPPLAVAPVTVEPECTTILQTANAGNLTSLASAVEKSSYAAAAIDPASVLTVFAPTNEAFNAPAVQALLATATPEQVDAVLGTHIVTGAVMAAALTNGQEITTISGQTLVVTIAGTTVTVKDPNGTVGTVVAADVMACGSVVHVIDSVLTPGAATATEAGPATPAASVAASPGAGPAPVAAAARTSKAGLGAAVAMAAVAFFM